jgi:hypothetical protein
VIRGLCIQSKDFGDLQTRLILYLPAFTLNYAVLIQNVKLGILGLCAWNVKMITPKKKITNVRNVIEI